MPHPPHRTRPNQIRARLREELALRLRIEGKTLSEIGQALGVSPQRAHYILKRALARIAAPEAEELRRLHLERLEALIRAHWQQAMAGRPFHTDRVLAALRQEAELFGLYESVVRHDLGQAIARILERLAEADRASPEGPGADAK
ncbi:sigma factor-like helix-turn-helix DNA-binding protein [Thermoflexus sp.]|uniref:sigma factor-like helix-turn-helix DNA-binding protein n=1 Tax=Thermoflexus sp. TaxID=1969742 RepID=UPI003C0E2CDF